MSTPEYTRTGADVALDPFDMAPEHLLAGSPNPRANTTTYAGEGLTIRTGFYALDPGTIVAEVAATETIHVLEGEMRIEFASGDAIDVRAGDVIVLPAGSRTTRTVRTPYREFWVHAQPA